MVDVGTRARFVNRIREQLNMIDGLPDACSTVEVVVGSHQMAEQVRIDLTPYEQERVRIKWLRSAPPAPPCEICQTPPAATCARCGAGACDPCDRCYGCEQLVCGSCDTGGGGTFTYPGDASPHPHGPQLTW